MSEWAQKRFWTETTVIEHSKGYGIALDGRPIKTPAKASLVVPTRACADAIAAEWDAQETEIAPLTMPVTRAANSAIDKIQTQRAEVVDLLAAYGETDLLCYRADKPQELVVRQAAAWDPLLDWAAERFDARLFVGEGVMFVQQDADALARLRAPLDSADVYTLAALHDLIALSGSLVIGLRAVELKDVAPLWAASRIDEAFQAEEWGQDDEAERAAKEKETAFFAAHKFYSLLNP